MWSNLRSATADWIGILSPIVWLISAFAAVETQKGKTEFTELQVVAVVLVATAAGWLSLFAIFWRIAIPSFRKLCEMQPATAFTVFAIAGFSGAVLFAAFELFVLEALMPQRAPLEDFVWIGIPLLLWGFGAILGYLAGGSESS